MCAVSGTSKSILARGKWRPPCPTFLVDITDNVNVLFLPSQSFKIFSSLRLFSYELICHVSTYPLIRKLVHSVKVYDADCIVHGGTSLLLS